MRTAPLALAALLLLPLSARAGDPEPAALETLEQRFSYVLGQEFGASLASMPVKIDFDALMEGIRHKVTNQRPRIDIGQAREVKTEVMTRVREQRAKRLSAEAQRNREEGIRYLADNRSRPGVESTASGLQYQVLQQGDGPRPGPRDVVKVHYYGTLVNGTEFDSSIRRREPAVFPLDQVIPGWTEGLQLMNVGAKYRFVIPPELAYGKRGAGEVIGPQATLIFEVELLSIEESH